jgi:hypothetical protein
MLSNAHLVACWLALIRSRVKRLGINGLLPASGVHLAETWTKITCRCSLSPRFFPVSSIHLDLKEGRLEEEQWGYSRFDQFAEINRVGMTAFLCLGEQRKKKTGLGTRFFMLSCWRGSLALLCRNLGFRYLKALYSLEQVLQSERTSQTSTSNLTPVCPRASR